MTDPEQLRDRVLDSQNADTIRKNRQNMSQNMTRNSLKNPVKGHLRLASVVALSSNGACGRRFGLPNYFFAVAASSSQQLPAAPARCEQLPAAPSSSRQVASSSQQLPAAPVISASSSQQLPPAGASSSQQGAAGS